MKPELESGPYAGALWQAVADLEEKRRQLQRMEAELQGARDAVDDALFRYAAVLGLSNEEVPADTIRALYWEHRDVRVDSIAQAFAIKGGAGQVHRHAGAHHVDVDCPGGCGRSVRLTARTTSVKQCEHCAAAEKERRDRQWQAQRAASAKRAAERDTWIREELEKGRSSGDLYAEMVGPFETNGPLPLIRRLEEEMRGAQDSSASSAPSGREDAPERSAAIRGRPD